MHSKLPLRSEGMLEKANWNVRKAGDLSDDISMGTVKY